MADPAWITLFDVSRDGIGLAPWAFLAMWLAGICAVGCALLTVRFSRLFLGIWLAFWSIAGGFGLGNVFYQYAANVHALKTGRCATVEGPIREFHPQPPWAKGEYERFVVNGHKFSYSRTNLGGGGLRSSDGFRPPLLDGIWVKVWYRDGAICRLDMRR